MNIITNPFLWRGKPSVFAADVAFIGASVGGIGLAQAVKLHNATRSKTSSINTAAADKQKAALV